MLGFLGVFPHHQRPFTGVALLITLTVFLTLGLSQASEDEASRYKNQGNPGNVLESDDDLFDSVVSDTPDGDDNLESRQKSSEDDDDDDDDDDDGLDEDDDDDEEEMEMHMRYEIVIEEFHDADTNKDLRLSLAEFTTFSHAQESEHSDQPEGAAQTVMSSEDQNKYKSEFASYDKNKDDLIGLPEARRPTFALHPARCVTCLPCKYLSATRLPRTQSLCARSRRAAHR